MACFGEFWAVFFSQCPRQKNVEFSAWSDELLDVEDVLLWSSEHAVRHVWVDKVGRRNCTVEKFNMIIYASCNIPAKKMKMALQYTLLHCHVSNLVLKILKHDKIWEENLHWRPPTPKSWGIYAHVGSRRRRRWRWRRSIITADAAARLWPGSRASQDVAPPQPPLVGNSRSRRPEIRRQFAVTWLARRRPPPFWAHTHR